MVFLLECYLFRLVFGLDLLENRILNRIKNPLLSIATPAAVVVYPSSVAVVCLTLHHSEYTFIGVRLELRSYSSNVALGFGIRNPSW